MKLWFTGGGVALCLFALWAIGRYDWLRLTRPTRRVTGEVIGYNAGITSGRRTYAPIYRFADEAGVHEVIDALFASTRNPPLGSTRELTYPEGHPQLARPPRPLMWVTVYLGFVGLTGMLAAKALDGLPHG